QDHRFAVALKRQNGKIAASFGHSSGVIQEEARVVGNAGRNLVASRNVKQFSVVSPTCQISFVNAARLISSRKEDPGAVRGPDRRGSASLAEGEPGAEAASKIQQPNISREIFGSIASCRSLPLRV